MDVSFTGNTGSRGVGVIDRRSVLALVGAALMPSVARAAQYPSRPIKIIVPYAPGGTIDITARLIASSRGEAGQPVVIDNRAGAAGTIGNMVAKSIARRLHATADHHQHPCRQSQPRARSALRSGKGLHLVGVFGSNGSYLMVRPEAAWRDRAGLIAAGKAAAGKVTFGHFNASSRMPGE